VTEREVIIGHRLGLHARVAARVVQLSTKYKSNIELFRNEQGKDITADGRSILSILLMAAGFGSRIIVRVDGVDEHEALESICEYLRG
jgi:phosphocarrier protein HPr